MDRKVLIALGVSVGIIWVWTRFVMIPPPPEGTEKPGVSRSADGKPVSPDSPSGKTVKSDAPGTVGVPAAGALPAGDAPVEGAPKPRQPEAFATVDVAGRYRAVLSTWGGALHELSLVEPRYKETVAGKDLPIDLVKPKEAPLPFSVSFLESGFELPADAEFTLVGQEGNERRYVWTSTGVRVEKRYSFVPDSYELRLDVTVENTGEKPLPAVMQISLSGYHDPVVEPSMFKPSVVQTQGLCSAGKAKRETLTALLKEPLDIVGNVGLIAIDRKYFVLAAAMAPEELSRCHVDGTKEGRITARLITAPHQIAPAAKHTWSVTGFAGPKVVAEIDAVKLADGKDAHLGVVMDYGFTEIFARPMLWVLKTIHSALGNWGVAIILLTILLKLITWWPTAQSMKSAASMAKLKPEMDKLREKYGDDKQRMNQEVMALYSKHKINPLGGCLPVLIQMPIYIALYSMLGNSVELYRASFGLWIHDLTGPDPFFVLPLATGGLMFLQQKLSPTPPDPQQKTMMTVMPIMFTGMSIFLPAGLTVYILTNTALSMLQQRISTPPKKV